MVDERDDTPEEIDVEFPRTWLDVLQAVGIEPGQQPEPTLSAEGSLIALTVVAPHTASNRALDRDRPAP